MFDNLSSRLQDIFSKLNAHGILKEEDVDKAMREVRLALLEADVNFKVVKEFVARVKEQAIGHEVLNSLTPGQQVISIVLKELTQLLGGSPSKLTLSNRVPKVIMMVGLQGSGKTTASAKLANLLRKRGMKPLMIACDVYRPAAIDQLESLGRELQIPVFRGESNKPVEIAQAGLAYAIENLNDLVIVDTAGRLHVDAGMMEEAAALKAVLKPDQILMVVDAMTGQDAVNVAQAFSQELDFDGVIMSKLDGDARGGAALSIREVTGKPIKFASFGEKADSLEEFHPDRMAKRILGMGDVVSLIEKASEAGLDEDLSEQDAKRLEQGKFTFDDFLKSIKQMRKLGGLGAIANMLPGGAQMKELQQNVDERQVDRIEAIVFSMTAAERANPQIINGKRRARIAAGSGTSVVEVNRLLKQFADAKKMMRQMQSSAMPKKKSKSKGKSKGKKNPKLPRFF